MAWQTLMNGRELLRARLVIEWHTRHYFNGLFVVAGFDSIPILSHREITAAIQTAIMLKYYPEKVVKWLDERLPKLWMVCK